MANRTDPDARTIHGTNPQVHCRFIDTEQLPGSHVFTELHYLSLAAEHGRKDIANENIRLDLLERALLCLDSRGSC